MEIRTFSRFRIVLARELKWFRGEYLYTGPVWNDSFGSFMPKAQNDPLFCFRSEIVVLHLPAGHHGELETGFYYLQRNSLHQKG